MNIDEVIDQLLRLKLLVGNAEVYTGGTDYCSEVCSIQVQKKHDPYIPKDSIRIWNKT